MPTISPLYIITLINKIDKALWEKFTEKKYVNVELYIKRWHREAQYDYYGNFIEDENFPVKYQDKSTNIDL